MWNGENHMIIDSYWDDDERFARQEEAEEAAMEHADDSWDDCEVQG